jgi:hypothetical protein
MQENMDVERLSVLPVPQLPVFATSWSLVVISLLQDLPAPLSGAHGCAG